MDPEKTFMRHKSEKDITFHLSMIVSEMRMRPGLVSINLRRSYEKTAASENPYIYSIKTS